MSTSAASNTLKSPQSLTTTPRKFRLNLLRHALMPLLLPLSLSVATAHADDNVTQVDINDPNLPSTTIDTIVVTANPLYYIDPSEDNDQYNANVATVGTKIPDYLENIPQSISVITQAKIEDMNLDTFDQMAKRTPGLRVLQNDDGRSSVYSRGYEYDQYSVDGLAAPMASINGTLPNLAAYDRVEVMRGPSGMFNSASEMGGVVNLVRKRGSADSKSSIKASLSNPKGFEVTADVQGSLNLADVNDDSLTARGIVQHKQQENPIVADAGGDDNTNSTVYLSVDKQLNDNSKFGVGYLFQKRNITPNNGLPTKEDLQLLPLPDSNFYGAKWNEFDSSSHDFFADYQQQLESKGIVSAGLRYSDRDADYNYAFAGSAITDDKVNVAGTSANIKETALSADINLSQPFATKGGQSEYVVGLDYKRFNTDSERGASRALAKSLTAKQINDLPYIDIIKNASNKTPGYRLTHEDNTLNETGLYAKVNYKPIDKLSLIVGGRISNYKATSKDIVKGTEASKKSSGKATGYGAVVYQLTPNINAYGSYTQVFMPQYLANKQGELLKPREGDQVEVGLKGHWSDTLSARLSAYRLKDENAAAPTKDRDMVALGERQMQGVELEVNGEVMPNLQISAGYSYLDSDIKQASDARNDGIFLLMPRNSGNIWANYQVNDLLPNPLTLGLGVNMVGKFSSGLGVKADGYNTWDAMVSYPFSKNLKGQLNVYNLLDKDHYVRVGSNNTFNIPGNEREVKASLTYEF